MAIEAILPPKGRDYRLDLLRGFANWAIFLDHIPNNAVNWLTSAITDSATRLTCSFSSRATRLHSSTRV